MSASPPPTAAPKPKPIQTEAKPKPKPTPTPKASAKPSRRGPVPAPLAGDHPSDRVAATQPSAGFVPPSVVAATPSALTVEQHGLSGLARLALLLALGAGAALLTIASLPDWALARTGGAGNMLLRRRLELAAVGLSTACGVLTVFLLERSLP